ncbi:hypothetical protein M422DRAFT_781029 [Sphaerobolus stellatus SS14]|uniref:NmrA-like domain-containing protein n=1 Tax=Sphaerobolus stellatus (strain SS14) TaxID=990650 RepID=A0A0C9VN81_SPHS4|nr:hypothetical protein M422DRAFT_781029 [Sphaerobolus stellatus SS14]
MSSEKQTVELHRQTILVTGSTGKQGYTVITALLSSSIPLNILALTATLPLPRRELLSEAAENENTKLSVVKGDLDDPSSVRQIFEAARKDGGIWGVFAIFAFPGLGANVDGEERKGLALADISYEFGVECYVLSTAERDGVANDDTWTLSHAAKINIERHVRSLREKGFKWASVPAFTLNVDFLLAVRIWAFYGTRRTALYFLGLLWTVEAAALFTIYTIAFKAYKASEVNPLEGLVPNCSAITNPALEQFVISYLWSSGFTFPRQAASFAFVYQAHRDPIGIYLAITLFRQWRTLHSRLVFSISPLYSIFIRDGIGYFFLIFGVNLGALLLERLGPVIFGALGTIWIVSGSSVLACRMVLNIRDAAKLNVSSGTDSEELSLTSIHFIRGQGNYGPQGQTSAVLDIHPAQK